MEPPRLGRRGTFGAPATLLRSIRASVGTSRPSARGLALLRVARPGSSGDYRAGGERLDGDLPARTRPGPHAAWAISGSRILAPPGSSVCSGRRIGRPPHAFGDSECAPLLDARPCSAIDPASGLRASYLPTPAVARLLTEPAPPSSSHLRFRPLSLNRRAESVTPVLRIHTVNIGRDDRIRTCDPLTPSPISTGCEPCGRGSFGMDWQ